MKLAAVIAEYNPFHNGHLYQLQEIRKRADADGILIMMSGDFVQRGAPACVDKYLRCRMALAAGADIVCELPVYGALASAELFAASAVALLNHLGCVQTLCFGAEYDSLDDLSQIARTLADEPDGYRKALKEGLRSGMNFPAARSHALGACLGRDFQAILKEPNNILAIEYLKALYKTDSPIRPLLLKRQGAGYHSLDVSGPFSSASAIRSQLERFSRPRGIVDRLAMPESSKALLYSYLENKGPLTRNDFSEMLAYRMTDPHLNPQSYMDVTADLANRMTALRYQCIRTESFIDLLTTRNLTASRISRCLFHILLRLKQETFEAWKSSGYDGYLRVLGFRRNAASFWKDIPESFRSRMVTRTGQAAAQLSGVGLEIFNTDLYASRLYRQALQCRYELPLPDVASEPLILI